MTGPLNNLDSDADVREFRESLAHSDQRMRLQRKPGILSLLLFGFSASCVWLTSDEGPFHAYWSTAGKLALLLALAALVHAVYRVGLWWAAWQVRREIRREYRTLLEDRYGISNDPSLAAEA